MRSSRILLLAFVIIGCRSDWAHHALTGTYHFGDPEGTCGTRVSLAALTLRDDGTFDEAVSFRDGSSGNISNGQWSYDHKTGTIHFSKLLLSDKTTFKAEPSHPQVIFLDSSDNEDMCIYTQPK
jgi:hypothetical protein